MIRPRHFVLLAVIIFGLVVADDVADSNLIPSIRLHGDLLVGILGLLVLGGLGWMFQRGVDAGVRIARGMDQPPREDEKTRASVG